VDGNEKWKTATGVGNAVRRHRNGNGMMAESGMAGYPYCLNSSKDFWWLVFSQAVGRCKT
jgi:hypothetical protein